MRYRLLATYQGAPYEAGLGPTDTDVVLFAACPPPEELRFEPATGHWRKTVSRREVGELHESRPVGTFRGEQCIVLDDLGDRLHIVYLGHDAYRAEQLGYWEIDRGVFELITPRHEVTDITEQRAVFPSASALTSAPTEAPEFIQPPGWGEPAKTDPSGAIAPTSLPANGAGPASNLLDAGDTGLVAGMVAVPMPAEAPLPLEALARAASARRSARGEPTTASHPIPAPVDQPAGISAPLAATPPSQKINAAAVPSWTPTHQPAAAPVPQDLVSAPFEDDFEAPLDHFAAPLDDFAPPLDDFAVPFDEIAPPEPVLPEPVLPEAALPESGLSRRRRGTKRRMTTQRIFSELAGQAAIPATAYAIGEDVEGAMCLIQSDDGYEVFTSAGGSRHEVRLFHDEESAYFYLFGVLVADAVRTGALAPSSGPAEP
jgi:hypothetical protein